MKNSCNYRIRERYKKEKYHGTGNTFRKNKWDTYSNKRDKGRNGRINNRKTKEIKRRKEGETARTEGELMLRGEWWMRRGGCFICDRLFTPFHRVSAPCGARHRPPGSDWPRLLAPRVPNSQHLAPRSSHDIQPSSLTPPPPQPTLWRPHRWAAETQLQRLVEEGKVQRLGKREREALSELVQWGLTFAVSCPQCIAVPRILSLTITSSNTSTKSVHIFDFTLTSTFMFIRFTHLI